MKRSFQIPRSSLFFCMALLLSACAQSRPASESAFASNAEPIRIDIVGTSDLHGWAEPSLATLPDGTSLSSGGLRNFSGYLDVLRQQLPDGVVLVDAGDVFQGTLLSNLFEGKSLIPVLNLLGYDAMAIGNHEFDYGPEGPRAAATHPSDNPIGALTALAQAAKFPLLAYNIYVSPGAERPAGISPTGLAIVERRGLKVGLLGITTPDTVNVTNPANVSSFRFEDMVAEAQSGAQALREAGADLLVGIFHEGNRCADLSDPNDLSSCDGDGGLIAVLKALPPGLFDAVIGGHTHARVGHFVNEMPVIQSGAQGSAFGIVELSIDPGTRRSIPGSSRIRSSIPVCEQIIVETGDCNAKRFKKGMSLTPATFEGQPIVPNVAVDALLSPFAQKVAEKQAQSLGAQVTRPLIRQYRSECPIGNAFSEVLLAATGADFALLNSGGLRADLKPGELTYGMLYEVLPFDNNVATLMLTGAQIAQMFETLLSSHHGIPQVAGLRLRVEHCKGAARVLEATDRNGNPLDPNKFYRMALSDFLAMGGDGLSVFLSSISAEHKDLGLTRELNMRDMIAAQIRDSSMGLPDPGIDGRMELLPCSDPAKAFPESQGKRPGADARRASH